MAKPSAEKWLRNIEWKISLTEQVWGLLREKKWWAVGAGMTGGGISSAAILTAYWPLFLFGAGALFCIVMGLRDWKRSQKPDPEPSPKPQAWEVPGAPQASFKLYVAACLLAGDEPLWPLPSQKARDGYKSILDAVESGELDEPGKEPSETLALAAGFMAGDERDDDPGTVHELKIPRQALRKYIKSIGRPVPEFLKKKFDAKD